MVSFGNVAGSRAMKVIVKNLENETAEDILSLVLNQLVPVTIKKYLPVDSTTATAKEMFGVSRSLLESGRFTDESTQQMLVTSLIQFAKSESDKKMLLSWFNRSDDGVTGSKDQVIGKLTLKQKHMIVKVVYSSLEITLEVKEAAMAKLSETKSDLLDQTKAFCCSALPDKANKRKIWDSLFGTEFDSLSLLDHGEYCAGFMQQSQMEMLAEYTDEFFAKIEDCVAKKPRNNSESIYGNLAPIINTNDADIKKFEDFLAKLQGQEQNESTTRLIRWVKDSVQDMKQK